MGKSIVYIREIPVFKTIYMPFGGNLRDNGACNQYQMHFRKCYYGGCRQLKNAFSNVTCWLSGVYAGKAGRIL
jgi:hypothetical protein